MSERTYVVLEAVGKDPREEHAVETFLLVGRFEAESVDDAVEKAHGPVDLTSPGGIPNYVAIAERNWVEVSGEVEVQLKLRPRGKTVSS